MRDVEISLLDQHLFCLCCMNCHELSILFWGRLSCLFLIFFVFSLHYIDFHCLQSLMPRYGFVKTRTVHTRFVFVWPGLFCLFRCREWHFGQEHVLLVHVLFCPCCVNCHELSILFWGRLSCLLSIFFVFSLHYIDFHCLQSLMPRYGFVKTRIVHTRFVLVWSAFFCFLSDAGSGSLVKNIFSWSMSCSACAAWIAMNCPSCFEVGWTAFFLFPLYFLCIISTSIVCKVSCPGMVLSRHG